MDRQTVYAGAVPLETDLLLTNQNAMVALGWLMQAILGTSTLVQGLACTATSPASLSVKVAPGQIFALENLEATALSSLPADTSHSIVKQGLSLDPVTLSCPAPGTSGYSVVHLVQAAYQDADTDSTVLPYYNAANPDTPYTGPGGTGTAQYTKRKGVCSVTVKAGVAAATGSQAAPAADTGYTGLFTVTVAYGQSTITAANIATVTGAPFLPAGGFPAAAFQGGYFNVATAAGTADAITASFTPAITALTHGMTLWVRAGSANATTAPTFTPNSGAIPADTIVKGAGAAVAPGDIAGAGHWLCLQRDQTLGKWVLLNPATGIAVVNGIVGSARNVRMSVTGASATATMTWDEVIVETALGGTSYRVVNTGGLTINLATTGAGGMDTGSAPVSGYVSIYAGYNPATGAKTLFACNVTTSSGSIYSGANAPSGYTETALVGVWPTNASSQFKQGIQIDRTVYFTLISVVSAGTATTYTSFSLSSAIPPNATSWGGYVGVTTTSAAGSSGSVAADASGTGAHTVACGSGVSGQNTTSPVWSVPIITAQTAYYNGSTSPSVGVGVSSYSF